MSFVAFGLAVTFAASGCQLLAAAVPGPGGPGGAGSFGPPGIGGTSIGGTSIGGTSGGGVAGAVGEPAAGSSNPPGGGDGAPAPIATFHSGRATVVLSDGTQLVLDRINPGPHLYAQFGSLVRWSNDTGWYLTIAGAGAEADMGPAYLTFDRITGTEHWTANDPLSCTVRVATASRAALNGTATCRAARWTDALDTGINGEHPVIKGQPAFSATVSFEARQ